MERGRERLRPRPLRALRRLVRRPRLPRAAYVALRCPRSRAVDLSTVVYSDRFFRYGLRLRARPAPLRRLVADDCGNGAPTERRPPKLRCGHSMPLHTPTVGTVLGAGLLVEASARVMAVSTRYAPAARRRRLGPRALTMVEETPFEGTGIGDRTPRRRPLAYRQSSRGLEPRRPPAGAAPRPRRPLSLSCVRAPSPSPPRPEFALAEERALAAPSPPEAPAESAYERVRDALAKVSPRVSAANMTPIEAVDKAGPEWAPRKVLNTERYNNGARAPLVGAAPVDGEVGAQRATVRAMLACSGLFYALAFVAFYLLSLP